MSEFTLPSVPPPPKPKAKPTAQQNNNLGMSTGLLQSNKLDISNGGQIEGELLTDSNISQEVQENFDEMLSENIAENTEGLDNLENLENSENIVDLQELENKQIENAEFCEWHLPAMFDAHYIDPFAVPADYLIAKDLDQLKIVWEEFYKRLDKIEKAAVKEASEVVLPSNNTIGINAEKVENSVNLD